jgi:hypothetical protein
MSSLPQQASMCHRAYTQNKTFFQGKRKQFKVVFNVNYTSV